MEQIFNEKDLNILSDRNISVEMVMEQLNYFSEGFPFLKINRGATANDGILLVDDAECSKYSESWSYALNGGVSCVKFVPASGAASRMFKDLFAFVDASYNTPTSKAEIEFFEKIKDFALYNSLNNFCIEDSGLSIPSLIEKGEYKYIVNSLISSRGLSYGDLPKGLLLFHGDATEARTAMEEHLVEGAMYAKGGDGVVNIHFTVSENHIELFKKLTESVACRYEDSLGVKFNIGFSVQKPETDTIAADKDNNPFRDNGEMVFRPGGHGSLIENLNDIDSDIIFIKNIDNVVPDNFKDDTVKYKALLAGIAVSLQEQIFKYGKMIDSGDYTIEDLREIILFIQQKLMVRLDDIKELEDSDLAIYLRGKLHRPLRVCGMVKNIGEPGGGPFITYCADGSYSPQILESSQIDMTDARAKEIFESSTHFNPVDLVCAVKNWSGDKYNLPDFVDITTGFISEKSKNGMVLKALERPGLWNGAMSDWNTVFVEVPISTFNPVKTVNDLLRETHSTK